MVVWSVLERIRVKPNILESFSAYLNEAIRYMYYTKFRNYVMKNTIEKSHYDTGVEGVSSVRMIYYAGYVESVKQKIAAYQKEYYSRPEVAEHKKEYSRAYYLSHKEAIIKKRTIRLVVTPLQEKLLQKDIEIVIKMNSEQRCTPTTMKTKKISQRSKVLKKQRENATKAIGAEKKNRTIRLNHSETIPVTLKLIFYAETIPRDKFQSSV